MKNVKRLVAVISAVIFSTSIFNASIETMADENKEIDNYQSDIKLYEESKEETKSESEDINENTNEESSDVQEVQNNEELSEDIENKESNDLADNSEVEEDEPYNESGENVDKDSPEQFIDNNESEEEENAEETDEVDSFDYLGPSDNDSRRAYWGGDYNSSHIYNINGLILKAVSYDNASLIGYDSVLSEKDEVLLPEQIYEHMKYSYSDFVTAYKLTEIGDYACAGLKASGWIDIPKYVRRIGKGAFMNCKNTTIIGLNGDIEEIGDMAFAGTGVKEIRIFGNCENLTAKAFANMKYMKYIYVGDSYKNYSSANNVLFDKDKTKLVYYPQARDGAGYVIPDSVIEIMPDAFNKCSNLHTITIPNSVQTIDNSSISMCDLLDNIYVDKDNNNFYDDDGVLIKKDNNELMVYPSHNSRTKYDIPQGSEAINSYAFRDAKNLTKINIPDTVTDIGEYAFDGCENLRSIRIPNSVASIGDYAFNECNNITSICIPDTVKDIGKTSLKYCDNLKVIWASQDQYNNLKDSLPKKINFIESNIYDRKDYKGDPIKIKADNVQCFEKIGDDVKEVPMTKESDGYYVHNPSASQLGTRYYYYKASINGEEYESPVISVSVSKIQNSWNSDGECIIDGVKYIKNEDNTLTVVGSDIGEGSELVLKGQVSYGDNTYNVTSIANNAFNKCSGLKSIKIEDGIKDIGDWAFAECPNLEKVEIADSVTNLGVGAFALSKKLKEVKLPGNVTDINTFTFNGCESLEGLELPQNIREIKTYAFMNCNNLKAVTIPDGIESIEQGAFYQLNDSIIFYAEGKKQAELLNNAGVDSKNIVTREWNLGNECIVNNIVYEKNDDDTVSIIGHTEKLNGDVVINSEITVEGINYKVIDVKYNAFNKCSGLKSIRIEDGIQDIEDWAFSECTGLEKVEIADSVTNLGIGVFALCTGLKEVKLSENLVKISSYTFNDCQSLESVDLPEGIKEIETYAFIDCNSLKRVKIPDNIEAIGQGAFYKLTDSTTLYVKGRSEQKLLNDSGVQSKNIATREWSLENQCVIDNIRYYKNSDEVVSIIGYTSDFGGDVVINNKINVEGSDYRIKYIRYNAFNKCSSLKSIVIKDGVEIIGNWAFCECTSLERVELPDSVTNLGQGAFALCPNLNYIQLSYNLFTIKSFTFNGCKCLESIDVPGSIEEIQENAFLNCPAKIQYI